MICTANSEIIAFLNKEKIRYILCPGEFMNIQFFEYDLCQNNKFVLSMMLENERILDHLLDSLPQIFISKLAKLISNGLDPSVIRRIILCTKVSASYDKINFIMTIDNIEFIDLFCTTNPISQTEYSSILFECTQSHFLEKLKYLAQTSKVKIDEGRLANILKQHIDIVIINTKIILSL
jgi:hypothetical protein